MGNYFHRFRDSINYTKELFSVGLFWKAINASKYFDFQIKINANMGIDKMKEVYSGVTRDIGRELYKELYYRRKRDLGREIRRYHRRKRDCSIAR